MSGPDDRDDELSPWERLEREREAGEVTDIIRQVLDLLKNAHVRERQLRDDFLAMTKVVASLVGSNGGLCDRIDEMGREIDDLKARLAAAPSREG